MVKFISGLELIPIHYVFTTSFLPSLCGFVKNLFSSRLHHSVMLKKNIPPLSPCDQINYCFYIKTLNI